MASLPTVIVTSVIRSSRPNESHGGLYLVDLNTGANEQVLDWNDGSISWEGRGQDRGLRGIAYHGDEIYIAASDEVFVYDQAFNRLRSFKQRYLKHCHEIFISNGRLYLTSTGFDSILEYDLKQQRFIKGYCLRYGTIGRAMKKIKRSPRPSLRIFDPEKEGGPEPRDTTHINNVTVFDGVIHVSGVGLRHVIAIENDRARTFARVPYWTHNARPFRDGVLMNCTELDHVVHADRRGRFIESFPIVRYADDELARNNLGRDHARQAFARGMCVHGNDLIIVGSSPATVTAYRIGNPNPVASVNLTMDVRNAVHGLEVWPGRPVTATGPTAGSTPGSTSTRNPQAVSV